MGLRKRKKAAKARELNSAQGIPVEGAYVTARCPACGRQAALEPFEGVKDLLYVTRVYGQRRCPSPRCGAHLFFVAEGEEGITTYPAQRIHVSREGLPEGVLSYLDEAIECLAAGCYMAAAQMTVRTLEEVCADRAVTGATLTERLHELSQETPLSPHLIDDVAILGLLGTGKGNGAANPSARVTKEQVEAALASTKAILEAAYQYDKLVDRLKTHEDRGRDAAQRYGT